MAQIANEPGTMLAYCQCLRCKEMFIETGEPFKMAETGSGIYWCSHTQNPLGPDGQVADHENCRPGRSCYEEG